MAYNIYPAVDENYEFPPEILAALKQSLNLRNVGAPMTTAQRNGLPTNELDPGYYIFNTDTQVFEVWRADFEEWHEGLEAPGTVKEWPGEVIPRGWRKEDGAELPRTQYAALFKAIGTKYGAGNGTTTFKLRDRSGLVAVDANSTYPLGSKGGAPTVTLTKDQMPVHEHTHPDTNAAPYYGTGTGWQSHDHAHLGDTTSGGEHEHAYVAQAVENKFTYGGSSGAWTARATVSTTGQGVHSHTLGTGGVNTNHYHDIAPDGGGKEHENMMPYVAAHFIIKY